MVDLALITALVPEILKIIAPALPAGSNPPGNDLINLIKQAINLVNNIGKPNVSATTTAADIIEALQNLLSTSDFSPHNLTVDAIQHLVNNTCQSGGNSQLPVPLPSSGGNSYNYVYTIDETTIPAIHGMSSGVFVSMVFAAWNRWQNKAKVRMKFHEDGDPDPNLTIAFGTVDPGGPTLAVTTTESQDGNPFRYTVSIDSTKNWTISKLFTCLIHEFGHALGIQNHSPVPTAIMCAVMDSAWEDRNPPDIDLTADDITELRNQTRWPPR